MIKKLILLFLTVSQILASSSFFEKGKRAELFELMDNEVPIFRITIPDEKLVELKESMQTEKYDFAKVVLEGKSVETIEFDKVKNATMVVELNGESKIFTKVQFDIGGSSARTYSRQAFNIRIKDKNKDLYGRTQFRLRSDPRDASYLRSKLACDLLNRMGIVSISANYALLYVNEEYFGFYVLMDSPKLPWIEQVFGEKDTKNLYKCKSGGAYLTEDSKDSCENENDNATEEDKVEWVNFLKAFDQAKTIEDVEKFMDIDHFTYTTVYDYLVGSYDHLTLGHNFSMYKNKDTGKWMIFYYDLDSEFGQDIMMTDFYNFTPLPNKDFEHYTVEQWFHNPFNVFIVGILGNHPRYEEKLKEVIRDTFNPAVLFPHIDELKDFIRPYVLHDLTPDENGINPGILNFKNPSDYTMDHFEANSEFTTINVPEVGSDALGVKYWILEKYRTVCKNYNLDCDPTYMDENYKYPIDEKVKGEIDVHRWDGYDWAKLLGFDPTQMGPAPDEPIPSETTPVEPAPVEPTPGAVDQEYEYKCLAQMAGYPCCKEGNTKVYYQDKDGDWGYDFKANEWCGITPFDGRKDDEVCWSEILGYPCCKGCIVYEIDEDGKWGYENNSWCGIQSYCS
eukprot:jgi/Orpsp1_1/1180589/evm.model.c7180000074007.1